MTKIKWIKIKNDQNKIDLNKIDQNDYDHWNDQIGWNQSNQV